MFYVQVFAGKLGHLSKHTHFVRHLLELHYFNKIFQFLWIFFLRKAILFEKPATSWAQSCNDFDPQSQT